MSDDRVADRVMNLLERLVIECVPSDLDYGPDEAACLRIPASVLLVSQHRFARDADGFLYAVVDEVHVIALTTCPFNSATGCQNCNYCTGDDADVVLLNFWNGHDDQEVETFFPPVEYTSAETTTYTTLRFEGLGITDAQAMTAAILI